MADVDSVIEQLGRRYGKTREEVLQAFSEMLEAEGYAPPAEPPIAPQAGVGGGEPKPAPPQATVGGGGPRMRPMEDSTEEVENPELKPELQPPGPEEIESTRLARAERMQLLPEYVENFFIEDLPPIDPADPWNQGVFMRFRINQVRQAKGKGPVGVDEASETPEGGSAMPPPAADSGGGGTPPGMGGTGAPPTPVPAAPVPAEPVA